ncbi:AfsR/SARP family transcriptional regulator [Micromonospora ureilytica]|uniref:AfsR/SARP family transcriptional regulator n=1 Tax=Micromonospora ureilytica TaxID=709868 RepID=UPI0040391800
MLAALCLQDGYTIRNRQLVEQLWADPPASADHNLRTYATILRRTLDQSCYCLRDALRTRRSQGGDGAGGYALAIRRDQCDLFRFREALQQGRNLMKVGLIDNAVTAFDAALGMWRGEAGDDLPSLGSALNSSLSALNSERASAFEDRAQLLLGRGEVWTVAEQMEIHVMRHPLRERPWQLLMLAHYFSGHVSDALGTYTKMRHVFAKDLGVEPGANLDRIHVAILRREDDYLRDLLPALPSAVRVTHG